MIEAMLQFRFAAETDTGLVRDNNEDSAFAGPYLLAVADGVGGAAAGEVASATTTYVVSAMALAHPGTHPARPAAVHAIEDARAQLRRASSADPTRHGMATTLTAILTDGRRFGLAHVGDSARLPAARRRAGPAHQRPHARAGDARHRADLRRGGGELAACATSCCRRSTPSRSPRPT